MIDHFGNPPCPTADHRGAQRHSFEQRQPQRLFARWLHKNIGGGGQGAGIGAPPRKDHPRLNPQFASQFFEPLAARPIADQQNHRIRMLFFEPAQRFQQNILPLNINQPPDTADHRRSGRQTELCVQIHWMDILWSHRVVDHLDFVRIHSALNPVVAAGTRISSHSAHLSVHPLRQLSREPLPVARAQMRNHRKSAFFGQKHSEQIAINLRAKNNQIRRLLRDDLFQATNRTAVNQRLIQRTNERNKLIHHPLNNPHQLMANCRFAAENRIGQNKHRNTQRFKLIEIAGLIQTADHRTEQLAVDLLQQRHQNNEGTAALRPRLQK